MFVSERKTVGHSGTVEVFAHVVDFRYWGADDVELTDALQAALEEEAEERAKNLIAKGYHSGELLCPWISNGVEFEIRGWWNIKSQ